MENRGGVDIFIGGGGDDLPFSRLGVMKDYASSYAAQTGRPTRYFPNDRVGQAVNAIRQGNADGGPVNIVGHSWGGPDAYNAVARANKQGLRVDNLITLDPVGGPLGRLKGSQHADSWMNVQASPSHPDFADTITNLPGLSHKPSYLPTQQAQDRIDLDLNHEQVDEMMRQSGARALLDRSRRLGAAATFGLAPPTTQQLHDNLPMMEWIRRRQAELSQGK